jgi:hypothetical protein
MHLYNKNGTLLYDRVPLILVNFIVVFGTGKINQIGNICISAFIKDEMEQKFIIVFG